MKRALITGALAIAGTALLAPSLGAQRPCSADTARTRFERFVSAPGAAISDQSRQIADLTSESTGTRVRVLARAAADAVSTKTVKALAFVVSGRPLEVRTAVVDAADLPALHRVLTAFETARAAGVAHDTRQKYTTPGGLEIETFWEGKQRAVAVTRTGSCPMSAYLDESALAQLRDAVGAGIAVLDSLGHR